MDDWWGLAWWPTGSQPPLPADTHHHHHRHRHNPMDGTTLAQSHTHRQPAGKTTRSTRSSPFRLIHRVHSTHFHYNHISRTSACMFACDCQAVSGRALGRRDSTINSGAVELLVAWECLCAASPACHTSLEHNSTFKPRAKRSFGYEKLHRSVTLLLRLYTHTHKSLHYRHILDFSPFAMAVSHTILHYVQFPRTHLLYVSVPRA